MQARATTRPGWAGTAALLGGVFVAATGSGLLRPEGQPIATFWPAAGFAVIALLLRPPREWALVAAGAGVAVAAANLATGRPVSISLAFGAANGIEAVVAASLITDMGRREPGLEDQEDFVRLLAGALVGSAVMAMASAFIVGNLGHAPFLLSTRNVLASHAAAILVLVPMAVASPSRWAGSRGELAVQAAALTVVSVVVFVTNDTPALPFAPVVFLVWAALRFDLRIAAGELVVFSVFVTAQTGQGLGPIGHAVSQGHMNPLTAGALTQGYCIVAALMTLPLGIVVQHGAALIERVRADEQLFRRNFTESLVGMVFLEPVAPSGDLVIAELNETAAAILGHDRDALVGVRVEEVVHIGAAYHNALSRILDGSLEGWQTEATLIGDRRGRVVFSLSQLSGADDQTIFAAQLLDITSEYDARRRLEVAEQLTSATLNTTACIILVTDLDGVIVRVNAATAHITGYAEHEVVGRSVWETGFAPSDTGDIEASILWPNRSGVPIVRERDATTKRGERLRIVWNTNIVRDEDGEAMYAVMTGIDVTAERATVGLVNHLMEASHTTALVGIDAAGRVTVANSGTQHLLGFERDELIGRPFHELLLTHELLDRTGADTPEEAFRILVRGLGRDGETRARDWTWLTKSGTHQLVSMTLSVAQDTIAAHGGYLCVARDVTEQRHSQEMLIAALDKERTAVERLRALDQAKNEFVSTVSHELRTPVTSIVGYTEMMQDGSVVDALPDQMPLLESISRNGQRLISVINDLLMLSSLDSDNVAWRQDPLDLAATVSTIEESVRPLLTGRRLDLHIEPPGYAIPVTGDRTQLERVLVNLLSNAVKFTEDGGRIALQMTVEGEEAVMRVSDTGIGIPADEQHGLFQRFFRTSTAQTRQIQGTGLGLSIVAAIVAAHHGTVSVQSAHLQGATFTVRIPLARAERLTYSA